MYDGQPHESKVSHEFVGGAAAFEAMHLFENQQREKGEAVNHGFAKEMLAAFAGAEVDKLIETKGLDAIDAEKAKHHARQQVNQMYDQQYGKTRPSESDCCPALTDMHRRYGHV